MKQLEEYINTLINQSFEGWTEDQINGYLTAMYSILEKINLQKLEDLKK